MMNFWQFVCEREAVRQKREAGTPPPWTADKVLQTVHFTNVFREDDPGTFVAVDIMSRAAPAWVRAWNLLLYRRLNKESTWRAIGGFMRHPNHEKLGPRLRAAPKPIFTGAHEIHSLHNYPHLGGDFITRQGNMMGMYDVIRDWSEAVAACDTARDAFKCTRDAGIPGVAGFLAWQLTLDLRYGVRPIGRYSDDEWAPVQAGCKLGLEIVLGKNNIYATLNHALDGIVYAQRVHFQDNGLKFPRRLTYSAMEHALCEYSKYARLSRGGHIKLNKFIPPKSV